MFARACALRNFYTAGQMSHSEQVGTGVDLLDSGILFGEKYLYDADEKEERITPATFDVTKIHAACEEVACYSTFPSDYGRFFLIFLLNPFMQCLEVRIVQRTNNDQYSE